jgi:hypothetical protein
MRQIENVDFSKRTMMPQMISNQHTFDSHHHTAGTCQAGVKYLGQHGPLTSCHIRNFSFGYLNA